jgi:hypothetical protein
MAARVHRYLSPDERDLVERSIKSGRFRDLEEFEQFAARQAVALLLLDELRQLRQSRGGKRLTPARVQREIRAVRLRLAKEYGIT